MLRKSICIYLSALLMSVGIYAQEQFRLYDWNLHTSFHNVVAADIDSKGRIWSGTSGGIFVYDENTDSATTFNSLNGILYNEVSYLKYNDNSKIIIVGLADGVLEIIDENFNITHITSIRDEKFANPKINKILFRDNVVYIAGGFGIALFDINTNTFISNVPRIANWTRNLEINDIYLHDNRLWAASSVGVAYCSLDDLPQVPNNWTTYGSANGLVQTNILSMAQKNGKLYYASDRHIYEYVDSSFVSIQEFEINIFHLTEINNDITVVHSQGLANMNAYTYYWGAANGVIKDDISDKLIILTPNGLLFRKNDTTIKTFSPNSPYSNIFSRMNFGVNGDLWTVSAHLSLAYYPGGITQFSDGIWKNYNTSTNPELRGNNFFEINVMPDGKVFSSLYGGGLAVGDPSIEPMTFRIYAHDNSEFSGLNNGEFLVVGDCRADAQGNAWCVNLGGTSYGPALVMIDKDGNDKGFPNCYQPNERRLLKLEVDNFGTKWFGSVPGDGNGIYYFNNSATGDKCGVVSTSTHSTLQNNSPTVIKKDASGLVWFGFRQGLNVVMNPSAVLSGSPISIRNVTSMSSEKINDIMFDPSGQVWLATATGIWVMSKGGYEVIANINKSNSPLLVDNILSLTGDFQKGIIYIGTEKGLYTAQTLSATPNDAFDIICYPQPFNVNRTSEMFIDGLAPDSEVRIVTINGEHIRTIKAVGRKAIWNGRDENNQLVQSGVYLVLAASAVSNSGSVQKIAIIR